MDGWLVYSFMAFEELIKSNSLPYCSTLNIIKSSFMYKEDNKYN